MDGNGLLTGGCLPGRPKPLPPPNPNGKPNPGTRGAKGDGAKEGDALGLGDGLGLWLLLGLGLGLGLRKGLGRTLGLGLPLLLGLVLLLGLTLRTLERDGVLGLMLLDSPEKLLGLPDTLTTLERTVLPTLGLAVTAGFPEGLTSPALAMLATGAMRLPGGLGLVTVREGSTIVFPVNGSSNALGNARTMRRNLIRTSACTLGGRSWARPTCLSTKLLTSLVPLLAVLPKPLRVNRNAPCAAPRAS